MASPLSQAFLAVFLASIVIFPTTTMSDDTCPYPCYPPPTGTGTGTPATATPSPPSQSGYYPPPAGYLYPPPAGNLPLYTPPPPYGGNQYGVTPPPPDPILPYFPFYYRKPPLQTDQSSAIALRESQVMAVTSSLLVLLSLIFYV